MHRHLRQQLPTSVVNSVGWHLQLKENRRSPGSQKQLTEEVIYESFVGLENISVNNTTTIPPPLSLPESDIIKDMENCTVCFFHLETTSISDHCEIVQISTVARDDLGQFDQYFYPNGSFSFGATKVRGIAKSSGKLFRHERLVNAVEVNVGLNWFECGWKNFVLALSAPTP